MLQIHVSNARERQQFEHAMGPLEFGRGPKRDATPRCVIQDDLYVSKDHVRIEEMAASRIRIENLSQRNPIWLADSTTIAPAGNRDVILPARLTVGETVIAVDAGPEDPVKAESLATIAKPVRGSQLLTESKTALLRLGDAPNPETLAHWFETLIAVQRAAAGSPEFYEQTAQAVVDLVGLDRGLVVLRRVNNWEPVARAGKTQHSGREFSLTILQQMVQERRTFFQSAASGSVISSLQGIEAVVASPIFDAQEQVVGAVYGSRTRFTDSTKGPGIGPLEAQVVQLLASAAGAGLARLEHEKEASRLRVQFEQFFSPHLARELERNPRMLEGQERVVTILFCDIRGFSRIAQQMSPKEICQLVSEVMGMVTMQVREHEGVAVDFAGDGQMGMWNAPADQPDHAALACRAVLAIRAELPKLSEAWQERLGAPLEMGMGLNTGPALVGNTGSQQKFKYGPLGHTVNVASRVEGATRQLGISALLTGSTRLMLGERFAVRRLCKGRLVGITDAVDLYELHAEQATPEWLARRDAYEQALSLYEAGEWGASCRAIYPVLSGQEGRYDIPSLNLVIRASECLKLPPKMFDPIIELTK